MFAEIASALAHGEALALLTVVRVHGSAPCVAGTRVLVRGDGRATGTLGGATTDARARADALAALASGQSALLTYHLDGEMGESVGSCGATLEIFVEPLRPEPRLLVAGSGYVAQALARLTAPLGWRVTLLDDRSEFLRAAALPEGVEVAVGEMAELLVERAPDTLTATVIVTRGHRADRDVLRAALSTGAGYIGMIGSLSKVRAIFRALLKEGATPESLARVHAPIGLDLHAQTPDEIALSIAAELLLWRRGGTGAPLKETAGILPQLREDAAAASQTPPPLPPEG
ncbi:MAG: XdhC family protein [Ktedonobacterales bacterium]|nr:XdhC family protein [Ktedonobacterales bacterium]